MLAENRELFAVVMIVFALKQPPSVLLKINRMTKA